MTTMCNISLCSELVGDPYFFWSVVMLPTTETVSLLLPTFFASTLGSSNSQGEHKGHVTTASIFSYEIIGITCQSESTTR